MEKAFNWNGDSSNNKLPLLQVVRKTITRLYREYNNGVFKEANGDKTQWAAAGIE